MKYVISNYKVQNSMLPKLCNDNWQIYWQTFIDIYCRLFGGDRESYLKIVIGANDTASGARNASQFDLTETPDRS